MTHTYGTGLDKNIIQRAEKGCPEAQFIVGKHLQEINNNAALSKTWYLKSAIQNYGPAQLFLARIFHREDNLTEAIFWYQSAAKHNTQCSDALYALYTIAKRLHGEKDIEFHHFLDNMAEYLNTKDAVHINRA